MSSLSDKYSKNFSSERKAEFNRRFSEDFDPAMSELSNILRILAEMRQGSAEGGIMRAAYNKAGLVNENDPMGKVQSEILKKILKNQPKKIDKEAEMFKTVEEFKKLKSDNFFFRNMDLGTFQEIKKKQKNLFSNKLVELNLKYPNKKFITEDGFVDKKLAKETIDQAIGELELSPTEGLTLVRAINTQGDQSKTSGTFNIGNFNFYSPNIEDGILQTDAAFNFGNLNLTGKADTKDSKLLSSELGLNLNNELMGSVTDTDDFRKTNLAFNKKFNLPKNFKVGATGNVDTFTIDGKTYKSSDLIPSLSYNDGILGADISKEILEGGSTPNLNLALNKNGFFAKGSNLLSEDRGGSLGYEKTVGSPNSNLYYTIGGEIDPFSGEKTAGAGIKFKFNKGGRVAYQDGTPERKNYETPVTDAIKSVNEKTMNLASQAVDAFDRYSGIDQITSSNFPGMNDSAIGAPSDFRHQAAANALAEALGKGKVGPVGYLSGGIGSFGLGTIKEIGDLFAGLYDENTTAKDAFSQAYEDTISNFKGAFAPTGTTSEDLYAEIMKDYVPNSLDMMPFRSRSFFKQQKQFKDKQALDILEKARAAKTAQAAAQAQTKAMAAKNRSEGRGGFQSDFAQDQGFMSGKGTAAEMGSFAKGGLARMLGE